LNYQRALEEIHAAGGIPTGTGQARPLSIVYCDADPAKAAQGVDFLVNHVHVPAILALFTETQAVNLIESYSDAGVFTLNPQDTPVQLKNTDVHQTVWNLLGTPDQIAPAYVPLMKRVENYWNFSLHPSDAATHSLKVAMITSGSNAGCPIEQAINAALTD